MWMILVICGLLSLVRMVALGSLVLLFSMVTVCVIVIVLVDSWVSWRNIEWDIVCGFNRRTILIRVVLGCMVLVCSASSNLVSSRGPLFAV